MPTQHTIPTPDEDIELYLSETRPEADVLLARLGRLEEGHPGRERRGERRIPTDDPASAQVLKPRSFTRLAVTVIDVSRGGLRLSTPEFIEIGSILKVQIKAVIAFGEVRFCAGSDGAFQVGVQLLDVV